jgi:hypothetical protein
MGAAGAAAAVIESKVRQLVERLRAAGATTPATAKTLDELRVDTRMAWVSLVNRGVIRSAPNGRYYLDEASWDAMVRGRRRGLWIVATLVVLAIVSAIVGVLRWPHH